jgi:hypothetical protein
MATGTLFKVTLGLSALCFLVFIFRFVLASKEKKAAMAAKSSPKMQLFIVVFPLLILLWLLLF